MNRFIKTIAAPLLLVLTLTSCEGVLDQAPLGELDSGTYYQNEEHFEAAILSPYSTLLNFTYEQFGTGWFAGFLMPDDDVRNPRGSNSEEEFTWTPSNGHFSYIWNESYKGIMRANVILDRLPAAQNFADESRKAVYEGEAKFMRAYFNFVLARNFGNVPIVRELIQSVADSRLGNSEPGEIWDFIEEDLERAIATLPEDWNESNKGRATRYSALALLGKVRLFRAQWFNDNSKYAQAKAAFDQIVNSGKFRLMEDYGDNFRIETENNAESLFEVQMTRGDFNPWLAVDHESNEGAAGSGRKIYMGAACDEGNCAPGANAFGYGQVHITTSLQSEFEPGDPRVYHTFYKDGDVYCEEGGGDGCPAIFSSLWSVTGATPSKYIRPFEPKGNPNNITTNNERIIRYADVLLMLAECELFTGNTQRAVDLINQVRTRARNNYEIVYGEPAPDGLLPPVQVGSQQEVFKALMHERRVELALEVVRYDDLVRWHRAGLINIKTDVDFGNPIAQANWQERHLLKPIPQGELDINPNLRQNPGY